MKRHLSTLALLLLAACSSRPADQSQMNGLLSPASPGDNGLELLGGAHGLRCDGTDETARFQALLDRAREANGIGRRVVLPAGRCTITSTLTWRGIAGAELLGQGAVVTEIEWKGDAASPAIYLDKVSHVRLASFSIVPADTASLKAAIKVENSATGCSADTGANCVNWATSQVTFEELVIDGEGRMEKGIWIAGDNGKNDHHRCEHTQVIDYTDVGYQIEGQASTDHVFTGCLAQGRNGGNYGVKAAQDSTAGKGGALRWFGGEVMENADADFYLDSRNGTQVISGATCEQSARFIDVPDPAPALSSQTIWVQGAKWTNNATVHPADEEIVRVEGGGALVIMGSQFGLNSPTLGYKFRYSPNQSGGGGFLFMGNVVNTTRTSAHFSDVAPDSKAGSVQWNGTTRQAFP